MVIKVPDIRIELIDYTTWVPIQGNLKDLYTDNFERLKNSLKQKGGFVPAFIWLDKGIPKILDAHQRHRLFVAENVEFEHIDGTKDKRYPCVIIEAENLKDAKERLLVISSQYGRMTQEGHDEFTFDIDAEFLTETTHFDAIISFGEVKYEDFDDSFSLADGDRDPFQQMTFTLADEQAEFIKNKIAEAKKTEEYKYLETFGNENGNGNALYLLIHG